MNYPSELLQGYGRLFEPMLPSRLGTKLMSLVHDGYTRGNVQAINEAISMLSRQHKRNIHSDDSRYSHTGWSKPTKHADALIEQLKKLINDEEFKLI